jgi:3-deoxy-D-manno-octulosonic-acid transferase
MILVYNLGIRVYYLLVLMVSPFNSKAKLWIKGRKNVLKDLKKNIDPEAEYVWFHASSLGEFEQGRPIIETIKKKFPGIKIILTFFSPSGYEVKKNYQGADYICYLPLDTKINARKFVRIINPKWVFFIKYEYWYNFLKQIKRNGSKLFLVSGIFRKEQLFFKPYGTWYRRMLRFFDHLFIQNSESATLLESIGVENYTIAGDSRFDRVIQIAEQSKEIEIASEFSKNSNVIVCGSTWEPDERILVEYIHSASENIKLIIAPHETHRAHIQQLEDLIKVPYVLFSQAGNANLNSARVLVIDNIGMLSSIYKYGQLAYIGGGFGAGIHNTLEAAVYGVPVIFGPNYKKFGEAVELIEAKGAFSITDYNEWKTLADNFFADNVSLESSGAAARNYVQKNKGATEILLNSLSKN